MSDTDKISWLIVGGGPAGLAAARSYREAGGAGRVAIVTDEHRLPYERPPLTKDLLRGESSEDDLPIEDEGWFERNGVELISGRVAALSPDTRVATLSGGRELPYAQCLLATGAEPARLPVPGADHPRVRVVRTLDHVRELNRHLDDESRVAVIGSGFIGCEIAASLRARGHAVGMISDEAAPNQGRLGDAAAEIIRGWLDDDGVELHLGVPLDRIAAADGRLALSASGDRIDADIVIMAAGVSPRTELAAQAGVELADGAIAVTAAMRTTQDGLLAAGDVCRAENLAAGRPLRVEHWGDALGQGAVAGHTAAGREDGWRAVPGFWSTIGRRTLKYAAWGDGYDDLRIERRSGGAFTVWYGQDGKLVGVLAHEADEDYESGREQIAAGAPWH